MSGKARTKKARADARRAERQDAARRRDLNAANVAFDPRIAAGQRDIEVRPFIDENNQSRKRASLADPGSLIKRQSERTEARTKAIAAFDDLCHRAYAGLYPEPRFERGVDVSRIPGVPPPRSDAMAEMRRLSARIGEEALAILHLRIFDRHSFEWMAAQGIGDPERLGILFMAAIDAVARFYCLSKPSKAVEAMERALQHV